MASHPYPSASRGKGVPHHPGLSSPPLPGPESPKIVLANTASPSRPQPLTESPAPSTGRIRSSLSPGRGHRFAYPYPRPRPGGGGAGEEGAREWPHRLLGVDVDAEGLLLQRLQRDLHGGGYVPRSGHPRPFPGKRWRGRGREREEEEGGGVGLGGGREGAGRACAA